MNQSIEGDIIAVMGAVRESGLLTAFCTITLPSGIFDEGGAPDPEAAYVALAGHANIPCIDAPMSESSSGPTEQKKLAEIMAGSYRDILLNGYYPAIQSHYRAIIVNAAGETAEYDIVGVDADSQRTQTSLALRKAGI